jgi:chromosome segregation ATPase
MVPKVVSDAGYTAVGLGVLAVQQVQTRRRETRSRISDQIQARRRGLESAVGQVKARIEPLQAKLEPLQAKLEPLQAKLEPLQAKLEPLQAKLEPLQAKLEPLKARLEAPVSAALGRLPQLHGPLGGLLVSGRDRIQAALRPEADEKPPVPPAAPGKGKAKAAPSSSSTAAD